MKDGDPSAEDGETSLQRWPLERPAVAKGVPSGTREGGDWVIGAPRVGSGERLVEQENGRGWAPGGGGGAGAILLQYSHETRMLKVVTKLYIL